MPLVEIKIPTYRVQNFEQNSNKEQLVEQLDLLEDIKLEAEVRTAINKRRVERCFGYIRGHLRKGTSCQNRWRRLPKTKKNWTLSGKTPIWSPPTTTRVPTSFKTPKGTSCHTPRMPNIYEIFIVKNFITCNLHYHSNSVNSINESVVFMNKLHLA